MYLIYLSDTYIYYILLTNKYNKQDYCYYSSYYYYIVPNSHHALGGLHLTYPQTDHLFRRIGTQTLSLGSAHLSLQLLERGREMFPLCSSLSLVLPLQSQGKYLLSKSSIHFQSKEAAVNFICGERAHGSTLVS